MLLDQVHHAGLLSIFGTSLWNFTRYFTFMFYKGSQKKSLCRSVSNMREVHAFGSNALTLLSKHLMQNYVFGTSMVRGNLTPNTPLGVVSSVLGYLIFKSSIILDLTEHQYKASQPGPENERTMTFHNDARVDGLVKRIETPAEMTEHFKDRDDFLFYKHVIFSKRVKKFGPQDGSTSANQRPILVRNCCIC